MYSKPFKAILIKPSFLWVNTPLFSLICHLNESMPSTKTYSTSMRTFLSIFLMTLFALSTQGQVTINEISYNPCGAQGSDGDCEFIELYNAGAVAVDVSGWTIDDPTFTFPAGTMIAAGEYVLVTDDGTFGNCTWENAVPAGVQTFVWTNGNLGNSGESFNLSDANGNLQNSFIYNDGFCGADGDCNSLQYIGLGANGDCTNWSAEIPTPGAANIVPELDCPGIGNFGAACDDGVATTVDDIIQMDCSCEGMTPDCVDLLLNVGDLCDDNDPMTVLDMVQSDCTCAGIIGGTCPGAFISEFAYDCDEDDANEVVEVAVPNTFTGNVADIQIDLYNGSNGNPYNTINVDAFTMGIDDGTYTYYSISGVTVQNGAPDGLALSFQNTLCEFISYEGTITANSGPAVGVTSTDVGVLQTNSTTCDETIQFVGGAWVNACATPGDVNTNLFCDVNFDCINEMTNFGDPCDDGDASTVGDVIQMDCSCAGTIPDCPDLMLNFGTPCDDGDDATVLDVIQMDCTCAGIIPGDCPNAFINEFAYDCVGNPDANESIEVCVPNSFTGDLADIQLDLYNGNGGAVYHTFTLDMFTLGSNNGVNTYYFWQGDGTLLQNGADGLALSFQGTTCEFISYEGAVMATDGIAEGMTSMNINGFQSNATECNQTLQLFNCTWVNACVTLGNINTDQDCMAIFDCPDILANIGDNCNDGNPNTEDDMITMECICEGTPIEFDCQDIFANIGDICDDLDPHTENDMVTVDCVCAGTPIIYECPDVFANIGDICNDNDITTFGDTIQIDCICMGTSIFDCPDFGANIGDLCNDENPDTENDTIQEDCTCVGTVIGFDCPDLEADIGDFCNDGDSETFFDLIQGDCSCAGTPVEYECPDLSTNYGTACDDNDPATEIDMILTDCTCGGYPDPACPDAFISEFGYDCGVIGDPNEVIEVTVPDTFTGNLADIQIDLYNGFDGTSYGAFTLDNFTLVTQAGGFSVYILSGVTLENGHEGIALSYQGGLCQYISYEGRFVPIIDRSLGLTAFDGPAAGFTSIDVEIEQTNNTPCDETIQFVNDQWIHACATPGELNTGDTCVVVYDCPDLILNFNAPCDDGNPETVNDVIQMDCSCAGVALEENCFGAFISEFAYDCGEADDPNEVIEVMIPDSLINDLSNFQIYLYNGSNGMPYDDVTLTDFTLGTQVNGFSIYSLSGTTLQNGPDAIALSYQGQLCEYIGYEGDILALGGIASGFTSTNVGIEQSNNTLCDQTIQLVDSLWVTACATPGEVNTSDLCMVTYDCPDLMLNFGNSCNDNNINTLNDVIQMDCTCAGTLTEANCFGVFISEFAYDCSDNDANELIEITVPNAFPGTLANLVVNLYDSNGMVYNTVSLSDFTVRVNDGVYTYYTLTGTSINDGTAGMSLSLNGANCEFISYGGILTATDGPAQDFVSTDVGLTQDETTSCDVSLQLFECEGWISACTTDGNVNNNLTDCTIAFDCPLLGLNVGDSCEDGDPLTMMDTVQPDCSCVGVVGCMTGDIIITEINYNPCSDIGSDSGYEFIELYNNGANDLSLEDWQMDEEESVFGMTSYTFPAITIPAGGYLVVAANATNYDGTMGLTLGVNLLDWNVSLSNIADEIVLYDCDGNLIDAVFYNDDGIDSGGFPECADGDNDFCATLALPTSNYTADNNVNTNWQVQTNGGSPGSANTTMTCDGMVPCSITVNSEEISICDNNGTPDDVTDDTFTIIVTATVANGSSSYTVNDGTNTSAATASGTSVVLGPYPADGSTTVNLTYSDASDTACSFSSPALGPVEACSVPAPCSIAIDSEVVSVCNNSGTPTDPADDTFTITVTATVTNGSGSYIVSDGTNTSAATASGTSVVLGPYPADGSTTVNLTYSDASDMACGANSTTLGPVNVCSAPACESTFIQNFPANNGQ